MPGAGKDARLWFCFYQILKGSAPSRAMPTQLRRARPMKTKSKGMSYAKWGYIFLAPFFITFFIFQFWPPRNAEPKFGSAAMESIALLLLV